MTSYKIHLTFKQDINLNVEKVNTSYTIKFYNDENYFVINYKKTTEDWKRFFKCEVPDINTSFIKFNAGKKIKSVYTSADYYFDIFFFIFEDDSCELITEAAVLYGKITTFNYQTKKCVLL